MSFRLRSKTCLTVLIAGCCLLVVRDFSWSQVRGVRPRGHDPARSVQLAAPSAPVARLQQVFELSTEFGDREVLRFDVTTPGRIVSEAVWRGSATNLSLILHGPAQVGYYARQDGSSPLRLEFEVTDKLLALGTEWRLSVVNSDPAGRASGRVVLTHPSRPISVSQLNPSIRQIVNLAQATPASPTPQATHSILPDGQVQIRYPDGTIEILDADCGSTKILPDGKTFHTTCNQVQTASLPPTPTDTTVRAFLESHRDQLLAQISRLVGNRQDEINLFLQFESSSTSSLYGQIKLRTELIDKLLP